MNYYKISQPIEALLQVEEVLESKGFEILQSAVNPEIEGDDAIFIDKESKTFFYYDGSAKSAIENIVSMGNTLNETNLKEIKQWQ